MHTGKHSSITDLSSFAIVESEVVAGFEVEGNSRVRNTLQIHGQHLLRHVIVIQLIVTQSHINIQGQKFSAELERNKSFVNIDAVLYEECVDIPYIIILFYKCIVRLLRGSGSYVDASSSEAPVLQ